jgi:hypothetical protein
VCIAAGCGPVPIRQTSKVWRDDLIAFGPDHPVRVVDDIKFTIDDPNLFGVLMQLTGVTGVATYSSFYLTHFWAPVKVNGKVVPIDLKESTTNGFMTRDAREAPGHTTWLYPNSNAQQLVTGTYRLSIDARAGRDGTQKITDGTVQARMFGHRATQSSSCGLQAEFIFPRGFVGGTATAQMLADQMVDKMNMIYAQVNVRVVRYWVREAQIANVDVVVDTRDPRMAALAVSQRALLGAKQNSLHYVFVNSIQQGDKMVTGYSLGLPGPYLFREPDGTPSANAAVLVALGEFGRPDTGSVDIDGAGTTCAHEGGHYLGLYHTSEQMTDDTDPITDTPECKAESSANCKETQNIMYWTGGKNRTVLTPGQGTVMWRHPLCLLGAQGVEAAPAALVETDSLDFDTTCVGGCAGADAGQVCKGSSCKLTDRTGQD